MQSTVLCRMTRCENPVKNKMRQLCRAHYARFLRHGDPAGVRSMRTSGGICIVDGCDRPWQTRRMCGMHAQRLKRNGDPHVFRPRYSSTEESLARRTEWQGDCLVWTQGTSVYGYGVISVQGKGQTVAHRYVWESVNGPIPDGLVIDHVCHNRACVNVEHLRLATRAQNNMNRSGSQSTSASGIRGVRWEPTRNRWVAQVAHGDKYYSKNHETVHGAVSDVNRVRREWFGEFAGPESAVPEDFVHPR